MNDKEDFEVLRNEDLVGNLMTKLMLIERRIKILQDPFYLVAKTPEERINLQEELTTLQQEQKKIINELREEMKKPRNKKPMSIWSKEDNWKNRIKRN